MQPVQLSLLPDQHPAPPVVSLTQFPGQQVAAAITLLACLITRASCPDTVQTMTATGEGDE